MLDSLKTSRALPDAAARTLFDLRNDSGVIRNETTATMREIRHQAVRVGAAVATAALVTAGAILGYLIVQVLRQP